MSEPAWVLRAIAENRSCPEDLSDQLLTWLALGGPGAADPLFDPVACAGHPGDTRSSRAAWYLEQAKGVSAELHPLWLVRAGVLRAVGRLPIERVQTLARDPRPEVRRAMAMAGQLPERIRRELMQDGDEQIAELASRIKPGDRPRVRVWRVVLVALVWLGMAAGLGLTIAQCAGPTHQPGALACRPHTSIVYVVAGSVGLTLHMANAPMTAGGPLRCGT
jgi:hypothetical protein